MGNCCGKSEEKKLVKTSPPTGLPSSPVKNVSPVGSPPNPTNDKQKTNTSDGTNPLKRGQPLQKNKKTPLFRSDPEDSDGEEKKPLMEDEKMEKMLKKSVSGGDSAYGKVMPKKTEEMKDIQVVKDYLGTKNYQLIGPIGAGNYAQVFKVMQNDKKKYIALKVIDLHKANENYRVNFLPKEIEILRKLKHSSIIKIYEISQTSNKIFMLMEYAVKGTLADMIRGSGAMVESFAWKMFKEILDPLHYMHCQNIAHRDLKLENILITKNSNPKLSDFSYAVIVDEKNPLSTTFCGSLPYFAPEIMQRKPYHPLQSDIWSLGVCLYVMVNDALPFNIKDERAMLHKQLNRDWDFKKRVASNLSPELKAMLRKMLEPDGNQRHTSKALVKDQWIITQPKQ